MKFTLHTGDATYRIRAYAEGEIVINDETHRRSLIVTPERLIQDWPPQSLAALTDDHLETVLALEPEVVLLGTGKTLQFPENRLLDRFFQKGLGIEIMDTAAACRTYNVLMSEGRIVAAAMLIS